jgi:ABC-2 type transport system permease protein
MFSRIKELIIKEFIQISRDKRMLLIVFIAPLIQLILFGYAITTDIENISTAIWDMDRTSESRDFISDIEDSGNFNLNYYVDSEHEITNLIESGDAQVAVRINPGFGKDIKNGVKAKIQIIIDGSDSNSAAVILGYINQISANYSNSILIERLKEFELLKQEYIETNIDSFSNETRFWFNPTLKSRFSNVPAVMAFVLLISTIMLTSMSIVKEKEAGTIEQLIVTPIKPIELIAGKTIPFAMIGFIDVLLVISVSYSWFGIPLRGNLLILFFSMILYLFATLGVGLFISTISRTQQQAMMSSFFFMMPAVLLSGFMFPIENMPTVIQYITYLNPLRYFFVIITGIFLKGTGLGILWPHMLALGIIGIVILTVSIFRFRKRIE